MSLQRALVPSLPRHPPLHGHSRARHGAPIGSRTPARQPRVSHGAEVAPPYLPFLPAFLTFFLEGRAGGWGGGSAGSPTQILPVPKGSSSHLPVIHRRCVRVRGGSPLHVSPSCLARYKTCAPFCSCQGERGGASGKGGGGGGKMLINPPALIFSSVRWSLGREGRSGEEGGGRGGRR